MLRSIKELRNDMLQAQDGDIGRCKDFLFDDQFWAIRYMVADTGKWLPKRKVLISPISLGEPNWPHGRIPVRLTRRAIENAPDLDEDAPVSRQYEITWTEYYGWPFYWGGTHAWGMLANPSALYGEQHHAEEKTKAAASGDEHLRSVHEVTGYTVQASDGSVGDVDDFIVDLDTWIIRYLVVDTGKWLPGRKVIIPPEWATSVDWVERDVDVNVTREQVKRSPEYDPAMPVNREYEAVLYDFYGRPKYW